MLSSEELVRRTRQSPRLKLPAQYTLLRVRIAGQERYQWTGHIYDISANGMRFELDNPIAPGTEVEIRAMLPGHEHTAVQASGKVVRLHDETERGPMRMGLHFERFTHRQDELRLKQYLNRASRMAA